MIKKINQIISKIKVIINIRSTILDIERKIKTIQLQNQNLSSIEMGITNKKYYRNQNIIISLTSHGKRIHDVYLTIESLMQQTVKPNKIILWLAEDEFTMDNIPVSLKKLQNRGLTIEFCEDIKSYKKLIPALKKYPDDIIITVDDDIIYQFDLVENLLDSYRQNPELIHFCRGHRIKFKDNNALEKYYNWNWYINDYLIDKTNFPTSGGGTLFPPHCLHSEVSNEDVFMTIAPYADDVWFKAMSLMQGTLSQKVFTRSSKGEDYICIDGEVQRETALGKINLTKNDEQIDAVFKKYGIYELLKQDDAKKTK